MKDGLASVYGLFCKEFADFGLSLDYEVFLDKGNKSLTVTNERVVLCLKLGCNYKLQINGAGQVKLEDVYLGNVAEGSDILAVHRYFYERLRGCKYYEG